MKHRMSYTSPTLSQINRTSNKMFFIISNINQSKALSLRKTATVGNLTGRIPNIKFL